MRDKGDHAEESSPQSGQMGRERPSRRASPSLPLPGLSHLLVMMPSSGRASIFVIAWRKYWNESVIVEDREHLFVAVARYLRGGVLSLSPSPGAVTQLAPPFGAGQTFEQQGTRSRSNIDIDACCYDFNRDAS